MKKRWAWGRWIKQWMRYFSLGILGELTFHRLYNVKSLRPALIDVGLIVESDWIPVELKLVEEKLNEP